MDKKIRFIKTVYWIGAIFDGLMIPPLLSTKIVGVMFRIPNFNPGISFHYASAIGAALMAGWTVLLIWAAGNPVERRDIMLFTLFPVLTGLTLAGIYPVIHGMITLGNMVPMWISQGILFIIGITAYLQARSVSGRFE
ncbi:MAG TPA: hypothetical protein VHP14_13150 [Anaerolineales bacterium]|nr:hypothetical protein [Anaerolineales bacterium]